MIRPRSNMAGSSRPSTSQSKALSNGSGKNTLEDYARAALRNVKRFQPAAKDLQDKNGVLETENEELETKNEGLKAKITVLETIIENLNFDLKTQTENPGKQTESYQTKIKDLVGENKRMSKELAKWPSGCMEELMGDLKKLDVIKPKPEKVVSGGAPQTAVVVFVNESPKNMSPEDSRNDEPIAKLEGSNTEQEEPKSNASSEQDETQSDAPLGQYDTPANYRTRRRKLVNSVGTKTKSKKRSRSDDAGEKQVQMAERSSSDEYGELRSEGQDAQFLLAMDEDKENSRQRSNSAL